MGWTPSTGKLTVDPINRQEGHMAASVKASYAPDGAPSQSVRIVRAEMHGNLFRGFENILPGKFKKKGSKRTFGRDPRDAMIITQRICGVCPIGHGTTSNKNIGKLYGYKIHDEDTGTALPVNAARLRNLCLAANHLMSHILHFYHLVALDYVNPGVPKPFLCPRYDPDHYISANRVTALATAAGYTVGGTGTYDPVLDALTNNGARSAQQTADYINQYLVGQYLKALDMRRIAHEMLAVFGGKGPHLAGYTPGGVTATVDTSRINAYQAGLTIIKNFVGEPLDFVNGVTGTMMFDTVAAAHLFPEYFWIGNAWGHFIAYGWGESDTSTNPVALSGQFGSAIWNGSTPLYPGAPTNGQLQNADNRLSLRGRRKTAVAGAAGWEDHTITPSGHGIPYTVAPAGIDGGTPGSGTERIIEAVKHSRYDQGSTYGDWKHPWNGKTAPYALADPDAAIATRKYSWLKSPRYKCDTDDAILVYEVGPLSRMVAQGTYIAGVLNVAGYPLCPAAGANGPNCSRNSPADPNRHPVLSGTLKACYDPLTGGNGGPDLSPILYNGDSTLDRIAARTVETRLMCDMAQHELNLLGTSIGTDPSLPSHMGPSGATPAGPSPDTYAPKKSYGYGMSEASRGALGHWILTDKKGRIKLYQCVVPTTWNGSPRDYNDDPGPAEKSLQGNNSDSTAENPNPAGAGVWIADPLEPIEIIRTTHSYDFCIACAVHIVTPDGKEVEVVVPPLP